MRKLFQQVRSFKANWRSKPAAGYLEAFDIAAVPGGVGRRQTLAGGVANARLPMAMDPIVLRNPGVLVVTLEEDFGFLSNVSASSIRLDVEAGSAGRTANGKF